jgi:hypothetical protein
VVYPDQEANCADANPGENPTDEKVAPSSIRGNPTDEKVVSSNKGGNPTTVAPKTKHVTISDTKEKVVNYGQPSDGSSIEVDEEMQIFNSPRLEPPKENPKQKRRHRVLMRKQEHELRLWHMRYGHIEGLRRMIQRRAVTGLPSSYHELFCQDDFCVYCLHGKQKKDDHGPINRTERVLGELWHVDLTHHNTESIGGKKIYTMAIIEHKSKVDMPEFLRKKSDAGEALKKVII